MKNPPKVVEDLIKSINGKIDDCQKLPDGSGFCTASFPLPKDHWLTKEGYNDPPMPMKIGTSDFNRKVMEQKIREAAKYAIRASTMNGKIDDFDPDAMVGNFIVGLLGYYTPTGDSSL